MDESSPDILAKYQKLAAEYSKLRAQTSVLKRAVSEEQGRNHDTKESLKEKDQCIRKLEQEVECLNFRNVQLTKRVSVLQSDLEASEEKIRKTKTKIASNPAPTSSDTQSILNTELLSRIQENEKLHQQIFESQLDHKKTVLELTGKVKVLEIQLQEQHSSMSGYIMKHEETISKLMQERAKFELTQNNFEKNIKDVKSKDEMCKQQLEHIKQELGMQLDEANKIIKEKILFHDKKWKNMNALNVPVLLRQKHNQLSSLIAEFKTVISEIVRQLSNLHTYMEEKLLGNNAQKDISGPVQKLTLFLHGNVTYLKAIDAAFEDFSAKIHKDTSTWLDVNCLKTASFHFTSYVRYLDKLLPYLLLSISAEDNCKGTTPRLKEIYKKLAIVSQSLIVSFSKLETYIKLLVETGCSNENIYFPVQRQVLIKKILSGLIAIQSQFQEARIVFGAKIMLDHDLPTMTEKTKNNDDCILSSIVSISTGIKKLETIMEENLCLMNCEVPYTPRGAKGKKIFIHPSVTEMNERGRQYMLSLQWKEPVSIPWEMSIKNHQTLINYADSRESLTQQLQTCQNKLMKLELEKEHWMVECQLLKTKQLRTSPSLGSINSDASTDSDQAFQVFVKSSVNQLVTQIQFADSKALAFQNECECLYQKLKLALKRNEILESDLVSSRDFIKSLNDKEKTLMKNYEDQLSTMSEHLAILNSTLTQQKDEIDALKQAGSNKNLKKGKGK